MYSGCSSNSTAVPLQMAFTSANAALPQPETSPTQNASAVLNRPQVPILCYHQIRNWSLADSKRSKDYIVPVANFIEQMRMLANNGYHTILPDQLYDYLIKGTPLPPKPIMITFDDTRAEQFTIADAELKKYGFKGVFFVMTVSLNRPGYMTKEQVKQLADEGNVIGSHTWNHSNVKNYLVEDWTKQIDKPSKQLEQITGRPVKYFAYPFGLWNKNAIEHLKQRGFKAAFQLSAKRDEQYPLFTIRRIIIPGEWTTAILQKRIIQSF
jgi:peptidoglycan/xylan/chitin deacetylase (PgdA/CDA1 family)